MALSLEELLAVDDRPITAVHVDEWKAEVNLRVMTGKERDELASLQSNGKAPSNADMRRALLARGLCDGDGKRFPVTAIEKIAERSGNALEQVMAAISDINGLSEEGRAKLLGKHGTNSNGATESSG